MQIAVDAFDKVPLYERAAAAAAAAAAASLIVKVRLLAINTIFSCASIIPLWVLCGDWRSKSGPMLCLVDT
jgi:hypothetical protein